jgi:iron complex transport system substrate-binding protein
MIGRKRLTLYFCLFLIGLIGLCSCSSSALNAVDNMIMGSGIKQTDSNITEESSKEVVYVSSMELQYAEKFSVDYFEGGYSLLKTTDGTKILVVPEGKEIPEGLDEKTIVLKQPIKKLYLVASGVMDMFDALGAIDTIKFSSQKEEDWYIESAKEAMEKGEMIYAGKYSKPDYELLVSENCSLAIQNMMISHSPEVIEMLENFGIPSIIEYSSYESHPLGRVEWVKFFGALVGKEKEAEEAFEKQVDILEEVAADERTDKTVAFFFITSNGLVQVRNSSDYVPKMIELAGGKYNFENLGDPESKRSTVNMQVEEFYNGAKDADFIIYNSSIDGGVQSIEELLAKCSVLEDFKAVREGNVWCTTNDMYQQSMSIGYLIEDIHSMLQGKSEEEMRYLFLIK